ncbi:MAG: ABC transporter permease [Elusimicrobia bacterium]|nr:ABC transporter permease [Elusimicrobiota bacterium]
MAKTAAYLRKALGDARSYRLGFGLALLSTVFSVVSYFFIDKLFGRQVAPHLAPFGVSYFSYVLVGMMASTYLGGALGAVSSMMREEQVWGTFEALLATPTGIFTIACAMASWNLIMASLETAVYVLAGVFVFGVDFSSVNLPAALIILSLAMVSFSAMGIISAAFILAFKRGDPLSIMMNLGMEILGGVFFPVTILPDWLKALSYLFPTTYAVRSLELAIYRGAGLADLRHDVAVLAVLSAVLVPMAYRSLGAALDYARRKGTLAQY